MNVRSIYYVVYYVVFFIAVLFGGVPTFARSGDIWSAKIANQDDFSVFDDDFGNASSAPVIVRRSDPLEKINRVVFHFNDKAYVTVIRPLGKIYRDVVPEKVRSCLGRMSINLRFPLRFVNAILQGKIDRAGKETSVLVHNLCAEVVHLLQPKDEDLRPYPSGEDFGQTLGHYGFSPGIPVVLPLIGPANLRDMLGIIPDYYLNPLSYISPTSSEWWVKSGDRLNFVSLHIGEYEALKQDALDPYTYFQDTYEQYRRQKVED